MIINYCFYFQSSFLAVIKIRFSCQYFYLIVFSKISIGLIAVRNFSIKTPPRHYLQYLQFILSNIWPLSSSVNGKATTREIHRHASTRARNDFRNLLKRISTSGCSCSSFSLIASAAPHVAPLHSAERSNYCTGLGGRQDWVIRHCVFLSAPSEP